MIFARAALVLIVTAGSAFAQTVASAPQDPKAQAQFEFMMARRMESSGDLPGALAALERARKLDPAAAEIPAEIAGYYYRQNRPTEAIAAAEQALKIDQDNVEAHSVLGNVFSAWADGVTPPPAGHTQASTRAAAIEHLTAIQNTPLMATNPNLQMTLGRLQLRAGKADLAVPILEKVAAQAPWSPQPLLLLYEAHVSQGTFAEAEQTLVQAADV
ncbi:MAG TPA: tetratricopeptide repeat protein, partial [Vicinamibacterales bacterium]